MKTKIDYLIVGQGLAGTWLSYFLWKAGKNIRVIDNGNPTAASKVASGIINPITGRRLVKSWKIDALLPFARQMYAELGQLLQADLCYDYPIVWLLSSIAELNNFDVLSDRAGYSHFIEKVAAEQFDESLQKHIGYAKIKGLHVDTALLLQKFRSFLQKNKLLQQDFLYFDDLIIEDDRICWKDICAKKILFCEGWRGLQNPYFQYLPFNVAKGETLLIHAPDLAAHQSIVKSKVFIVPKGKQNFWIGSTYVWDELNEIPSASGYQNLCQRLEASIRVPYTVLAQQAGIRPTTKQRRPFVGLHPKYLSLGIFNGLGTKGVSLSPYFAHQFVTYLLEGKALDKVVAI